MDYVFAIFGLGFVITLVVAKGVMQAHEFANEELEKAGESRSGSGNSEITPPQATHL